jgi:hypothetical protein
MAALGIGSPKNRVEGGRGQAACLTLSVRLTQERVYEPASVEVLTYDCKNVAWHGT